MNLHHITNDDQHDHHKFLYFSSDKKPKEFQTFECEAPGQYGLNPNRSLPFKVGHRETMTFITSFNGLVCVGITNHKVCSYVYSHIVLWNPSTGDYKTLSKPKSYKEDKPYEQCYKIHGGASGLYYSASDDDYRLLRITEYLSFYIYSLKSDSWRKLDYLQRLPTPINAETWGTSNLLNEKLYFKLSNSVIRFDIKTQKFTEISIPSFGDGDVACLKSMLLEKNQKIHLCLIYSSGEADSTELGAKLWRMDEDGDGDEEWKHVATYPIPRNFYLYEPHHLKRNGNWLTLCRARCHVHNVDPAKDFKKISKHRVNNVPPKGKYIETLVSPNLYRR